MPKICSGCSLEKENSDFRKRSGKCRACENAYQREHYWANPTKARAKAVKSMRKLRADPVRKVPHLEKRRAYYHSKGKLGECAYYERLKTSDPWGWKVRNLRRNINPAITVEWLRSIWEGQKGQCALTGRPLDIVTAELDHIIPKSKNGSDDLENLRLLTPEANAAKGSMTDAEFIALCRDVLSEAQIPEMIGRAIMEIAA